VKSSKRWASSGLSNPSIGSGMFTLSFSLPFAATSWRTMASEESSTVAM
jgi:hypothetical protein